MTHPVKGIDHCYLLVNDLENAAQNFKNLGFTLSPRGLHSPHMGTANYTIMLQNDYFELLGVVDETPISKLQLAKLASQDEGLRAVVGRIDHAKHAHESLIKLGFDVEDVQSFSKPVKMPNGEKAMAAFETVTVKPKHVPNGIFFLCEHKTKNMVWQPQLMKHDNGALAIGRIYIVAEDFSYRAKAYAQLFADSELENMAFEGIEVNTGDNSAKFALFSPQGFQYRFAHIDLNDLTQGAYAGFSVLVENLDKVKALLDRHEMTWYESCDQTIYVEPKLTNGAVIEFSQKL